MQEVTKEVETSSREVYAKYISLESDDIVHASVRLQ